jgi:hypothetical protein
VILVVGELLALAVLLDDPERGLGRNPEDRFEIGDLDRARVERKGLLLAVSLVIGEREDDRDLILLSLCLPQRVVTAPENVKYIGTDLPLRSVRLTFAVAKRILVWCSGSIGSSASG